MAEPKDASTEWNRLAELFETVASLPESEREAYLASATSDAGLRREVESLLAAPEPGHDVLEQGAFDLYSQWSDESQRAPRRLAPGELLARRFRIEDFLGRGGMGEVYSAFDGELQDRVALKILHAEWNTDFLDRFRNEIRLARKVTHPNIARVFDFGQDRGLVFYTMELLEGLTLAEHLTRHGALSLAKVEEVARQIAAGLDAAHAAGIMHRDFKPGNVMLTPERAVILDFGLAAPLETERRAGASTTMLLGTPGYVAPEQWQAAQIGTRQVTAAADIYAFGVTLAEMITGKHPRELGGNSLPSPWRERVERCLEPDPDRRWPKASAMFEPQRPLGGLPTRRLWLGLAGAAAFGGVLWLRGPSASIAGRPGMKIALAPLENHSGDAAFLAWPSALSRQLDLSRFLDPVPLPVADREQALRQNAALLLYSSISAINGEYQIDLRLESLGPSTAFARRAWRRQFTASRKLDVLQLASAAGDWIRETAGENQQEISRRAQAPELLSSANWEALRLYQQAEEARLQAQLPRALALYRQAYGLDPNFAMAAGRASDLSAQLNSLDECFAWQEKASALLDRLAPLTREALRMRISLAIDTWSFDQGEEAARLMQTQFPEDPIADYYAADFHRFRGRFEQALALYEVAAQKRRTDYILDKLAWTCLSLKRFDQASTWIAEARQLATPFRSQRLLGVAAQLRGDYAQAESIFREMKERGVRVGSASGAEAQLAAFGYLHLAGLEAEQSRWAKATAVLEEAAAWSRRLNRSGDLLPVGLHLAELYLVQTRRREAEDSLALVEQSSAGVWTKLRAGEYRARLGLPVDSNLLTRRFTLPRLVAAQHRLAGEVALAANRYSQAREHFESARAMAWREEWPGGLLRTLRRARQLADWERLRSGLAEQTASLWGSPLGNPPGALALIDVMD